jgi:hypothetical protein
MPEILSVHRTTGVNAPSQLGPEIPLPNCTIHGLRVKFNAGNTDGAAVLRFYINGVEQAADLTIPDGDDEISVSGLSYSATDDDYGHFGIIAPMPTELPIPPYSFYVYYTPTEFVLPNSTAPTVNANGEIAVDTSVADFSHGLIKYYGGEELGVVAMPIAEFTTPSDGHVVAYNATNDEFELVAQSGGGVDTANSPGAGEWAKFTDADTIEGRTNSELLADLSLEIGTDVQAHDDFLDDIAALTDPNADRIMFWDDSVGAVTWLTVGTNLSITDDTISASLAGGAVDTANSPNANEYARFVDADTIEGRTESEFKADFNLEIGTDVLAQSHTSLGKHTIYIPASAMIAATTSGPASSQMESSTNDINYQVLAFDATADEHAHFNVAFPKSWNLGTITYQVFWSSSATDTDGVAWGLQGIAISDNEAIDTAWGTAVVVTDDCQSAANELYVTSESGAVTIGGTPADDDLVYFRIFRDVSDANDDATEDALLIGVKLFYTTDAGTDA